MFVYYQKLYHPISHQVTEQNHCTDTRRGVTIQVTLPSSSKEPLKNHSIILFHPVKILCAILFSEINIISKCCKVHYTTQSINLKKDYDNFNISK